MSYQSGQSRLNGILVIRLCFLRICFQKLQCMNCRFVKLFMQRFHLSLKFYNLLILCNSISVKPLSQHTGGGVCTACKFHTFVQRIAQPHGPFVMSNFGCLGFTQHHLRLRISGPHFLHPQNVHGRNAA